MTEKSSAPASASSSGPDANESLCDYRRLHQQRYEERQRLEEKRVEEAERRLQESADVELARKLHREEELIRETQVASDEEYSRQLYEQLNDATAPHQSAHAQLVPDDSVRAPLRTGYSERLIADSPTSSASHAQASRLFPNVDDSMQGSQHLLSDLERGTNEADPTGFFGRSFFASRAMALCILLLSTAMFLGTAASRIWT